MELRDKLFTEEQYIKQLAKYYCRIEKLNSMIEQSEVFTTDYYSIFYR